MHIRSETLKQFRKTASLSQTELADQTQIAPSTIKRIEAAEGDYQCQPKVARKLAQFFKVSPEDLAKPASESTKAARRVRDLGYQNIGPKVDGDTALAYQVIEKQYGISVKRQVQMAPLFAAILAESSLKWRQQKLDEMVEAANRLMATTVGCGHLNYAASCYHVHEAAPDEQKSINNRDLFGDQISEKAWDFGLDSDTQNPFADYLRHLVSTLELDTDVIAIDGTYLEFDDNKGYPSYDLWSEELYRITGGSYPARAALKYGFAQLRDIPDDLLGEEKTAERVEWLSNKLPPQIRALQEKYQEEDKELATLLDPSLLETKDKEK